VVTRNVTEAMVAPMGVSGICVWREPGVRRSVLCCCVWQESGLSRRENIFKFNLVYKDTL
jgi:hypothetical protein